MKDLPFTLIIRSIKDIVDCHEYDIVFYKNGEKYSGGGTAPTVEECFDDAMDYYLEVMEGYAEYVAAEDEEDFFDDFLGFDEEGDQ
jgi:hypothetical protein